MSSLPKLLLCSFASGSAVVKLNVFCLFVFWFICLFVCFMQTCMLGDDSCSMIVSLTTRRIS